MLQRNLHITAGLNKPAFLIQFKSCCLLSFGSIAIRSCGLLLSVTLDSLQYYGSCARPWQDRGRGRAGGQCRGRRTSTLSWHRPATGSTAFRLGAKTNNSSDGMPKWIRAGMAKKHLMLFKCYLVDGSGWYQSAIESVLCYSPWEQSRWPYVGYSKSLANHILKQISDSWVLKRNFSYSIQARVQQWCLRSENLAHFLLVPFRLKG